MQRAVVGPSSTARDVVISRPTAQEVVFLVKANKEKEERNEKQGKQFFSVPTLLYLFCDRVRLHVSVGLSLRS